MYSTSYLSIHNTVFGRDENRASLLKLHGRSPLPLVLFRILLGGVRIELKNGKRATQDYNYFVLGSPRRSGYSLGDEILRAFPNLGQQDRSGNYLSYTLARSLDKYFGSTWANKGFFQVLVNEIARSLVASQNGNDLAGFVYIYRALEHMSYALPLFHAKHATNYLKAFNDLRALITTGDGELKFCEKFIRHVFSSNPICANFKYSIVFDPMYRSAYEKYMKAVHSSQCSVTASGVEVEFLKAFSFLVDVRNKFFHHLSGSNQSASSKEIEDADQFFCPINKVAWSVVGVVLGKMISDEL